MGERFDELHLLALHRTNSGGVVPLCRCGWAGGVEVVGGPGELPVRDYDREQAAALSRAAKKHRDHMAEARALARQQQLDGPVGALVQLGRFGHT